MPSYFSSLSPVPSFPAYTGPYSVGTIDIELPISELDSASPQPEDAADTVLFRVFYPCQRAESTKDRKSEENIYWLPDPQREHVKAYAKFGGLGTLMAEILSYVPRLLHYIKIPVIADARLLPPNTPTSRWPTMIFSHGLGGSRNAYSHLVGSIASHGVVVIAPEHRDGSTAISYVRDVPTSQTTGTEKSGPAAAKKRAAKTVDYRKIAHVPSPEVEAGRTAQLRIRLWELGCIHSALLKIDQGGPLTNLNTKSAPLSIFAGKLGVHEPGSISFAGHSFGGATVTQFVKSTFYAPETSSAPSTYKPLFTPSSRSPIMAQITAETPVILLDVWCFPLRAASSKWLWEKPFPCYSPAGPGGSRILAIESQSFVNWRVHLKATKYLLSPHPTSEKPYAVDELGRPAVHFYYPKDSAHLSQSDFGVLFPWLTAKVMGALEPERLLRLNVRAILQLLRESSVSVAPTSDEDMEIEATPKGSRKLEEQDSREASEETLVNGNGRFAKARTFNDDTIFGEDGAVRGWIRLTTDVSDLHDVDFVVDSKAGVDAEPVEAVVEGEIMTMA